MTIEQLVVDAKNLAQPTEKAYNEYSAKQNELAGILFTDLLNTEGFDDVVRTENTEMLKDNLNNQFKFMESVYLRYEPKVFVNTIAWAFNVYLSHGFDRRFWDFLFPSVLKLYRENLTFESYAQLGPFYQWMQAHKADFIALAS